MVSDFVRTGTLVEPLRHVLRSPRAYDLIEPRGRGSAGARTFVFWLLRQAEPHRQFESAMRKGRQIVDAP